MSENATIQIPDDVLKPIIEANIKSSVLSALNGKRDALIEGAVSHCLNVKVDSRGKPDNYGKNWIDWAITDAVQTVAKEALKEAVEAMRPVIKKRVQTVFKSDKSPIVRGLVDSMVESIVTAASKEYSVNVKFEINGKQY